MSPNVLRKFCSLKLCTHFSYALILLTELAYLDWSGTELAYGATTSTSSSSKVKSCPASG